MYARFCIISFMTLCVFMLVLWLRLWASVAFLFQSFYYFLGFFPFLRVSLLRLRFNSFTFQIILSVLVFRFFLQVCVCICACARCGKALA